MSRVRIFRKRDVYVESALKVLGVLKRMTLEYIISQDSLKFYVAYFNFMVRSILEYGSVIYEPYTASDSAQLERVYNVYY